MNVVLGITGGIAAYKACDLITMLKRDGHNIDVIVTQAGLEFITPLTLQTLSKNPVYSDLFCQLDNVKPEHISLAERANIFVIYPATANIIGKIANGIADDLLSTVASAIVGRHSGQFKAYIAPAMNSNMWNNIAVQKNIKTLEEMNFKILGPIEGQLACGYKAIGAAMKPKDVFNAIMEDWRKINE